MMGTMRVSKSSSSHVATSGAMRLRTAESSSVASCAMKWVWCRA